MHDLAAGLALSAFPAILIAAGLCDLLTMTIPNRLSAALAVGFLPAALLVGLDLPTALACLGAGAVGLVVGVGLFALRLIGGGDAKIMAAAALWLGAPAAPVFVLWTAMAGGGFALVLLAAREQVQPYLGGAPAWLGRLMAPRGDIPYGIAIAVGGLAAFTQSPVFAAFHGVF